ncbi:MscL family protein [Nocardioides sp.]|uniref:MscL family protein n=1 Tax=Nocardioides sp. TaxID=35761 RepID=UPI00273448CD|nr:MscL family protein [Nocardioides sp.]MDP3890085.1 MscL family protein [Nocardioides sp.]
MNGFKNFILRGNVIDLAVAVIVATAFNTVVATFTNWLTSLMPKGVDNIFVNEENSFGAFLNATISFLILAAVVYFFIVVPYTKAKERYFPSAAPGTPDDIKLLQEIRDVLRARA